MAPSCWMPPFITGITCIIAGTMLEFEKLQIMPLGFEYLGSLEKSEKKYTNTTHIGLSLLKFTRPNGKY